MINPPPTRTRSSASALGMLRVPFRRALVLAVCACVLPAPAARGATAQPWSWPLDGSPTVVRGFELPPEPWLAGHRGVDLRGWPGEPVRSAGDGTVTFAGWVGGIPTVTVTHAAGLRTTYQPVLAEVTRGQAVARGAILGRVSAGGSHCPPLACLHWGLRRARAYLDPLSLVGAGLRVRLLPVWSGSRPSPTSTATAQLAGYPATADATPTAGRRHVPSPASDARSDPARLGALNRARALPWGRWC